MYVIYGRSTRIVTQAREDARSADVRVMQWTHDYSSRAVVFWMISIILIIFCLQL
jgi:hypothetical protein